MATTLDCLLHPYDCGVALGRGDVSTTSLAEGSRRSAAAASDGASSEVDAASSGSGLQGIIGAATAPLHELSSTAMWTTIGIVAGSIVILVVFGYIVLKVL